jgi:Protein of unknown function (DUF3551)
LNEECSSVTAQRISNVGQALQLFHFFFMSMAQLYPTSHLPCAIHTNAKTERQREKLMKTKQILKISAAPATALFAMAFVAMATPAAAVASIDYCRHDVTSGMRGCGYTSLEQCQAMSSGRGGSCYENPFPSGGSSSAYAYQATHTHSKSARKQVENR